MKCTACGEYIYKGRKFNARKETTDEKYLSITIYRFYIRCTRCSGEITFKTDPKNMDYASERGAKRNFEMWRNVDAKANVETDEERLDRLEREEAEKDAMDQLETKMVDAKREMQIADALDEIRTKNARVERAAHEGSAGVALVQDEKDEERERQEREDEEMAKAAFSGAGGVKVRRIAEENVEDEEPKVKGKDKAMEDAASMPPPPTFKKGVKRKKDFSAALGIKKKPALV